MKAILLISLLVTLSACGLDSPPEKKTEAVSKDTAPPSEDEVAMTPAPIGEVEISDLKPIPPSSLREKLLALSYVSNAPVQGEHFLEIKNPSLQQLKIMQCASRAKLEGTQEFLLDLVKTPGELSKKDEHQRQLFHELAKTDAVDIAQSLIACGITDGATSGDDQGRIPLHYAKSRAMIELLWSLATRGKKSTAGYATEDHQKQLPLHVYAAEHILDGVAYYREQFCYSKGNLLRPILNPLHGDLLNRTDELGRTPLHLAAIADDADIADLLASCDTVNLDVKDKQQHTPMREAAEHAKFVTGFVILENAQKRHVQY